MTDRTVRLATEDDRPVIRAIYNHYVLTSTCTFQTEPLDDDEHRRWFAERSAGHPVTVAVLGEVVGWGALSPWRSRCAYDHTVEASVYVRHDLHRKGVGRLLLLDLIERARRAGHHALVGSTCAEQEGSLALQRSLGFHEVGRLLEVGFKFGRWLDVVYMELLLGTEEARCRAT
jgi:phosphinothricin acetyltransferase